MPYINLQSILSSPEHFDQLAGEFARIAGKRTGDEAITYNTVNKKFRIIHADDLDDLPNGTIECVSPYTFNDIISSEVSATGSAEAGQILEWMKNRD